MGKPRQVVFKTPALPHEYPVGRKDFGSSKDDDTSVDVLAHLPCTIRPGSYPVTIRTSGLKRQATPGQFTVTSDIAPRCKDRTGSDTERLASGASVELSRTPPQDPQRGAEVAFTVKADVPTQWHNDSLVLRSPAFVRPVRRGMRDFQLEPAGSAFWAQVNCDTRPGTYPVEVVRGDGHGNPLAATAFTVPERMDQVQRQSCAGPQRNHAIGEHPSEYEPTVDPAPRKGHGPGTAAMTGIASAALLAAAGGAFLVFRRRRRG
ncbi:hypothetical protein [Streptomyces orinoci]|uniref:Gram-positive cocci surface proteins LPxTG domain-containing protein n=1 Tax=Streptomyces orinoci TaxID=67339 RepID=A0ABV3JZC3_STRON|nr:hypothetical protein [Streptomyces orinoci]